MSATVQVCGVFEEDNDCVPFVPDGAADYYGVYICDPLAVWIADFLHKDEALFYASALAQHNGYRLDDRTFAERINP